MTYEEYKKMIELNEDRMEEFIRSVPMHELFNIVKSKLKLENVSFTVKYESGSRRRYGTVYDIYIDYASDNIADINPIFKVAFSEVLLTPFGGGTVRIVSNNKYVSSRTYETLDYDERPEFKFHVNVYLFHKSHSGGENGDYLCDATYTERDGWNIEWGNE